MKKNLFVQKQPICSTLYFFHHNFFLDEYLSYFFLHPSNVIYTQTHFFKEYVPKNRMYNINLLPFPNLYALPCCTHLSLYTLLRYLHSFLYISLSISPISSILFLSLSPHLPQLFFPSFHSLHLPFYLFWKLRILFAMANPNQNKNTNPISTAAHNPSRL